MNNNLPKPDDTNGWDRRMEEMFGSIFAPDIPKPVAPEKESEK